MIRKVDNNTVVVDLPWFPSSLQPMIIHWEWKGFTFKFPNAVVFTSDLDLKVGLYRWLNPHLGGSGMHPYDIKTQIPYSDISAIVNDIMAKYQELTE